MNTQLQIQLKKKRISITRIFFFHSLIMTSVFIFFSIVTNLIRLKKEEKKYIHYRTKS